MILLEISNNRKSNSILSPLIKAGFILTCMLLMLSCTPPAKATTVDIMFVYDTTATTWITTNGGMTTFSQDIVTRMNQAIQNSGVDLTFRHVHSMPVNYSTTSTPTTPLSNDLFALQGGTGVFAEVQTARNTYGADLVAMLVDHGSAYGYVGVGYLLSSWSGSPSYAFTVNAIRSVAISHTLTHEVGHNLGAHHSKYQTSSPGPNTYLTSPTAPYSAGWYFTGTNSTKYHTIMAYNTDGYGNYYQEAPLFSTPLITWNGTAAGDATNGDNSALLRLTKETIAGYRAAIPTSYALNVNSVGASSVAINSSPSTYAGTTNYSRTGIASGTGITLTAPATVGSANFSSWSGCDSNSGVTCNLSMTGDKTVTANYTTTTIPLGQAVDNTDLTWTTGGSDNWTGQTVTYFYGASAAQSGQIGDSQESSIQTIATGPGTLHFYWKVSSESDYDFLRFFINGTEQNGSISGNTGWTQMTFTIPAGTNTLKWVYTKDESISENEDQGWLDKVEWTPSSSQKEFPWPMFLPAITKGSN